MLKIFVFQRNVGFLIVLCAVSMISIYGYVYTQPLHSDLPKFAPGKILVKLRPEYSIDTLHDINRKIGVLSVNKLKLEKWYSVRLPLGVDVLRTIQKYRKLFSVEYAEPCYLRYLCFTPNDQYFSQQWGLKQSNDCDIDADLAWDIEQGASTFKIGILDSGIDLDHPDLVDNLLNGYDFVDEDSIYWDQRG